jgi:tRNA wybutosine-synthesizing protein 3
MSAEKYFFENKEKVLASLKKSCSKNEVDKKILSILSVINNSKMYYTSSSCAGRIILLELPQIGDKRNARILGKWHRSIQSHDLLSSLDSAEQGVIWLLAQSPIFHIVSKTNKAADKLLKLAISSGFKNSGIKSTSKNIVVEISSTERLDTPVGKDSIFYCNSEYLQLIISIANEIIEKSTIKLQRFKHQLRKHVDID